MAITIVQGVFNVNPEDRDRFIEASLDGMRSSRTEEGCLEYVMAADPVDPGRVVLSERWASSEHLAQHMERLKAKRSAPGPDVEARPAPLSREITVFEVVAT